MKNLNLLDLELNDLEVSEVEFLNVEDSMAMGEGQASFIPSLSYTSTSIIATSTSSI